MSTKSNLPADLVEEEILPKVPLTCLRSVRSTCREWNASSRNRILGKAARKPFVWFMMMNYRVWSMKLDLQGIRNSSDSVNLSVKQVSLFDQIEVTQILHCDGLLLCVLRDRSKLLVWNPYLGQIRWIQPRQNFDFLDRYAIGYDKNRNHKILRIFGEHRTVVLGYEIYDLSSSSWKEVTYVTPDWEIPFHQRSVSLKGNTYFLAQTVGERMVADILVSFDFTTERFGPRLPLPYPCDDQSVSLSCVRDEQLAVLYLRWEIWTTNKIDPYAVSWSKFLRHFLGFRVHIYDGSFLIDEEENAAVVFDLDQYKGGSCRYQTAHILGQDGYFNSVNIGKALNLHKPAATPPLICSPYAPRRHFRPLVCSSYVPSLVQLHPAKEKQTHL